jgi:hypothetical protein
MVDQVEVATFKELAYRNLLLFQRKNPNGAKDIQLSNEEETQNRGDMVTEWINNIIDERKFQLHIRILHKGLWLRHFI